MYCLKTRLLYRTAVRLWRHNRGKEKVFDNHTARVVKFVRNVSQKCLRLLDLLRRAGMKGRVLPQQLAAILLNFLVVQMFLHRLHYSIDGFHNGIVRVLNVPKGS